MEKEYGTAGRHIMADLWGVDFALLDDEYGAVGRMVVAAEKSGATVEYVSVKKFEPNGYTIVLTLSESHCSIHTYPEKGFAALDAYTCGDTVDPQIIIDHLVEYLNPESISERRMLRGVRNLGIMETWKLDNSHNT